ncbi:MAG: AAA family ATPase, partial [Ilumatobacteraceae bacterium]
MAAALEVRVMGEPGVAVGGRPVDAVMSARLVSLLGLLIVHRETPMLRQRIAFSLWPDSTEPQARTNLRQALHHLKRALPDSDRHLDVDGPTLRWRLDSPAQVDLIALDAAAARAGAAEADRRTLEQAVDAYPGDFLPGCDEEWVTPIRERLHREHVERLELLCDRCEDEGDADAGIRWAHRMLVVDPFHEATYRRLMRLYGPAERARAVRTYHACVAVLECELGVQPSTETVAVYERMLAERMTDRASQGRPPVPAPRFVGRAAEREQLKLAVRNAASQHTCHVVLVHGEPGIGKSRLVADAVGWCDRHSIATVSTRAYEAEGRLPFAPIADVLRSSAVRPAMARIDKVWADELSRIVPDVLAERDVRPPAAIVDGSERTRLFTAVAEAIATLAGPLVVAVDDLQWCDAETLELLHYVARTSTGVPLVILGTARDDALGDGPLATFVGALRSIDALVDIPLGRLARDDAAALVTAAIGHQPADDALQRVVAAGDGNPLFLVEMARGDIEPANGQLVLPSKVQAVIEARLAALSPDGRAVAEVLAVVGRRADVDLLACLQPAAHGDVAGALDELWRCRILVEVGADEYDFGHDRIRDVAYSGIGPARRRVLHRAVADALRTRPGVSLDDIAAAVAAHYERAGVVDAALDHYLAAVEAAVRVFACDEVITLAHRALALLNRLPDGPERIARELSFLGPLAVAIHAGPGMSLQNQYVFDRIAALRAAGGPPIDASVLRLAANSAIVRRRFDEAAGIGADLLAQGETSDDGILLTEGHYLLGVTAFWLGDFARSAEHLERSLAAYDANRLEVHLQRFGQDPWSICLVRLAMTTTQLGRIHDAERLRADALRHAADVGHDYTTQYVRVFAAWAA